MKKVKEKIIIGEEFLIGGGYIGFIRNENTEKFPDEITFIDKIDNITFLFGNNENNMYDYKEWEEFIKNYPIGNEQIKDFILKRMKEEIENY